MDSIGSIVSIQAWAFPKSSTYITKISIYISNIKRKENLMNISTVTNMISKSVVLILLVLSMTVLSSCESDSPFEAGNKQIDFVVVNSSSKIIKVLASGTSGYGSTLNPGEQTGGSGYNVEWVEVSIYIIRDGDWDKVSDHRFYSSGTWHYRG